MPKSGERLWDRASQPQPQLSMTRETVHAFVEDVPVAPVDNQRRQGTEAVAAFDDRRTNEALAPGNRERIEDEAHLDLQLVAHTPDLAVADLHRRFLSHKRGEATSEDKACYVFPILYHRFSLCFFVVFGLKKIDRADGGLRRTEVVFFYVADFRAAVGAGIDLGIEIEIAYADRRLDIPMLP